VGFPASSTALAACLPRAEADAREEARDPAGVSMLLSSIFLHEEARDCGGVSM
jgi:hypothetical protein